MAMALPYADHRDERSDCCVLARRREVRAYLGGSGTGVSQGRWARVGTHLRRFCREAACVEAVEQDGLESSSSGLDMFLIDISSDDDPV